MLLEGLRVVEMSTWIAGPGCAMVMGEWGADVIKVESGSGDPIRNMWPDTPESPGNPCFSMENRGKRAIVLDTSMPEGREALIRLLKTADVFVTNIRPGALVRARLDYASIKDELPRLVYAQVTGYGLEGPEADVPAFDMTAFWTRTGAAYATIPPDQEPFACRNGFGDHATAMATLSGVLAALIERQRTGRGRHVEASLMRMGIYALAWDMGPQLRYGHAVTAQPSDKRPGAMSGYFHTGDDRWLCLSPRGPKCLPALMGVIGRTELLDEPRFARPITNQDAVREMRGIITQAFESMTLAQVGEKLNKADLVWAPMATLDEVVADPQAQAAGCFVDTPDLWGGSFKAPAQPIRFPGLPIGPRGPGPMLGQHTRQVLAEAGYDHDAIETLLREGFAAQSAPMEEE